jgi:hypothetical protein
MARPSGLSKQTDRIVDSERFFIDKNTELFSITGKTYKRYLNDFFNASVSYYFDKTGDIYVLCLERGNIYTLGKSILTNVGKTTGILEGLVVMLESETETSNPYWMYDDESVLHFVGDSSEELYNSGDTTLLSEPLVIKTLSRLLPFTDSLYYKVDFPEELE